MSEVSCPVCNKCFSESTINSHVNSCLNIQEEWEEETDTAGNTCHVLSPPRKLARLDNHRKGETTTISRNLNQDDKHFESELFHKKSLQPTTCPMKGADMTQISTSAKNIPKETCKNNNIKEKITGEPEQPEKNAFSMMIRNSSKTTTTNLKPSGTSPKKSLIAKSPKIESKTQNMNISLSSNQMKSPSNQHISSNNAKKVPDSTSRKSSHAPLAERMRPLSFSGYVGQEHILGRGKMLRELLLNGKVPSMILWGPPGCGKTTLARIVSQQAKEGREYRFVALSATTAGVSDVKEVVKIAKNEIALSKRKTILFVDEIHRFNKLQQDLFLPYVEDGTITLIGATTENPSFQVNSALLSRCKVLTLEKMSSKNIEAILKKALIELDVRIFSPGEAAQSIDENNVCMQQEALTCLTHYSDGDARMALNTLQLAVDSVTCGMSPRVVTADTIKESLQRSHVKYDRNGEEHYNCASALQKSIRGSDDNGAIYWLSRMLEGGEDPLFLARRLVVCASEDIGMADPQALPLAVAAFQACTFIGMPECAINLSHCATYLARAPKSNESYCAMKQARQSIREHEGPLPGVPLHLRNAPTKLMKDLGYGKGYKYSHDHPGGDNQTYLPKELGGLNFFSGT